MAGSRQRRRFQEIDHAHARRDCSGGLVTQLADALAALDEVLRREPKTMAEAVTALLYRRRLVLGGVAITVTVLAALVALLHASL